MFLAARFLIGFGVAIAHGASPLLITELVHTQHRAIFTTIYNSTCPYIPSQVFLCVSINKIQPRGTWAPLSRRGSPSALTISRTIGPGELRQSSRLRRRSFKSSLSGLSPNHLDSSSTKANTSRPLRFWRTATPMATKRMKWFSWRCTRSRRPFG